MAKRVMKEEIVMAAHDLFMRMGFKRVGLTDVCRHAQVSRKTFYVYFSNKNELIGEVLNRYFDESWEQYNAIMAGEGSVEEKVLRVMKMKMMKSESMSMEFLNDLFSADNKEVQAIYQKNVDKAIGLMEDFYRTMQNDGLIDADIEMEVLFYFQNKILEMCQDKSYRALFADVDQMMRRTINFFMNGITQHSQRGV